MGARSNAPKLVRTTDVRARSVASAGRSLNSESPFRSRPAVMLYGRPDASVINGLTRSPHGADIEPFICTRWRTSKPARLYSGERSYWLEGKVPAPSVLLIACPNA